MSARISKRNLKFPGGGGALLREVREKISKQKQGRRRREERGGEGEERRSFERSSAYPATSGGRLSLLLVPEKVAGRATILNSARLLSLFFEEFSLSHLSMRISHLIIFYMRRLKY